MHNTKFEIMKRFYIPLLAAILIVACKPGNYVDDIPEFTPNNDSSIVLSLNPRAIVDSVDPNMVHLIMDDKEGWVGVWTIGTKRFAQNKLDRRFEFAGDYVVQAAAYNKYGLTPSVTVMFSIESMDEAICTNPNYAALTGGCDMPEGKTWVLSQEKGYYGLIDVNTWVLEYMTDYWWPADPGSHPEVFDDEITFVLDANRTFKHKTNGKSALDSAPYDIADYESTWELQDPSQSKDGRMHLTLSGDAVLPPFPSECQGQHDYTILVLNDTVMLTKIYKSGSNQAWVNKFVPKAE